MRSLALVFTLLLGCARAPGNGLPTNAEQACASCHSDHGAAFESSAHARASESPVFQALLPRVGASWGEAARARCVACHAPAHGDDAAITCVSCHAAVGNLGARDGRLVLDLDAPLMGPFEGARAPHTTRTSGLLTSSELCASCHEVTGPSLFVEHTGSEHASAAVTTGSPACAACHLRRLEDGAVAPGGPVRERHDHAFVGFDASTLAAALELRFVDHALELENVGAGHAVPTGVAFLRDVWVDLDVTHADGTVEHLPRVIELGDRPMRGAAPVALPTEADRIEERRLAPFEVRRVAIAADAVTASATLHARAYRQDALDALEISPLAAPPIEVTTTGHTYSDTR